MKNILWIFLAGLFIIACNSEPAKDAWQPMNLLEYGIPLDINAPLDAEVKTNDYGVMKDVSIKKGDDYFIQIYASQATTLDKAKVLAQQKELVKGESSFQKITLEEDNGFIYESKVDTTTTYGFKHVKLQGDNEYIFRTGLLGFFTEAEVKRMYESVK